VVEAGGASALSFSIDPFNETVNTRTGTIRVSAVGGSSSTWVVTQNPLSDWDEDGVPDEWEQRGAPAADGTRIALSGGYFGSNGIFNPVTSPPYGRIYPGSVAPANPAYEYRDLWVWIDEMVLSSNLTLNDVALKAISKSFDRHSIRVIWRRAPRESGMTLLSPKTLDFGNGTESEMIAVARDFVESAKSTNFLKAAALSSLDKIYRYVIWGVNIASADPSSCPDGVSFHNHGINGIYLGANGCATPDGLDRFGTLRKDADQAATLMHELGHSLGLNHGGPQFKSAADAAAGRLWNGANYPLEADYDSEQNRKPNHTSIMNYNFSNYAGVVARNPEYSLDYQNINFDTIDEQNLFQFWRTPVASGGNSNDDFGTIFHCNGEKRISRPGDKNIKCAPDTILFTQRPMSTDLTNDTHQTRNKLVSHTEWDRLIFPMTWLNVEGASALSLRDREPGVQFGKQLPRDYDVSISTPLLGVLKVLRGGQATLNIRLTNEGSQTDQYALAPQDLGSLGLAGVVALTVPSATELKGSESRTLPLQISVASNAPVGTYETYVVAKSDNNPIGASVLLRIEVVTDPNLVSSIPTDTTSQSVDEFSFIDVSGAELSTYYETTPVVITGLNVPIPVLVRDGQVSINSAPWTQYIATVRPGDTLRLRVLSSQYGGDTRRAEVLLGGLLRRFSVTTSTTCNLDIDGDNVVSPSTDGVLLSRFLLGYRDSALTNGLTLSGSRVTPQVIADFIGSAAQYEVFGRVAAPIATVDGLVLTRLMLGLPDSSILNGVDVPSDAEFARPAEIRSFVNKKCGVNFASP
jgi:hypothetical protein